MNFEYKHHIIIIVITIIISYIATLTGRAKLYTQRHPQGKQLSKKRKIKYRKLSISVPIYRDLKNMTVEDHGTEAMTAKKNFEIRFDFGVCQ